MPVIIRLQNLPWSANSVDIRKFFQGLAIPDGGVHIVGGEKGDAFIAFASDEDARQAMARNNGVIRDSGIKLFLSSRNEMQRVIEQARSGITASEPEGAAIKSADNLTAKRLTASQTPASVTHTSTAAPAPVTRARSRSPVNRIQTSQATSNNNSSLDNNNAAQIRMQQEMARHMIQSSPMAGLTPLPAPLPVPSGLRPQLMGYGVDTVPLNIEAQRQQALGVEQMNWTRRGADFGNGRMPMPDVGRVENMYRPPLADPRAAAGMDPRQVDLQASQIDLNGRRIAPPVGNISQPAFTGRLELRGLPFNVTPRDIQDFFRVGVGMFVPDDCIKILVDDRGLTTGGATVRMANESDLRAALELNGRLMNDRRIDVMPLLNDIPAPIDVSRLNGRPMAGQLGGQTIIPQTLPPPPQQAVVPQQPPPQQQQSLPQRDYVIYMKGIPFNACTDRDVGNFFQGLTITEIVFEVDRHTGKPAGNAFVEFPTREAYEGALALNLRHMGRRYIEVFPTTRDDMEEARRVANNANPEKPTYCVNVTGLPPSITNADLTSYFKEFGAVPYAIHIMLKANGLNAGEAFLEFSTPEHQAIAASRDGDVISNSRISVKEVPFHIMRKIVRPFVPPVGPAGIRNGNDFRPNFDQERRPFVRNDRFDDRRGGRGGGRGGGRISPNRRRDPFSDPRCVVHASNVPYKATNDELRAFFCDFATVDGGIERRMNERGLATPEARIAFRSSLEAERAVKTMHKKFIQGRPVFLRLAV